MQGEEKKADDAWLKRSDPGTSQPENTYSGDPTNDAGVGVGVGIIVYNP